MEYLGIDDDEFIRGKVPMTKQEIRILSLVKARLSSDSLVYDIGAGTGAISVEAARLMADGMVFAIEPMITEGTYEVEVLDDEWTYVTADRKMAAHYENSVIITDGEPEIITLVK